MYNCCFLNFNLIRLYIMSLLFIVNTESENQVIIINMYNYIYGAIIYINIDIDIESFYFL